MKSSKIGFANVDLHRKHRTGCSEVIFGKGKTFDQISKIAEVLLRNDQNVLATRVEKEIAKSLLKKFRCGKYCEVSKVFSIIKEVPKVSKSFIAVVTAGTSDMFVAEEASLTAEFFGSKVERFYDCGVAGLHRLISEIDGIRKARVVIAVAGMEGALPSVLAGLVKVPVIAVPTSVGYGANFGGISALLAMINSCANGVSVVNIDNGYGAGYNAHLINTLK